MNDEGRDSWGVWDGHEHIAVFEMDDHKDLLYSQGTLLNVMRQPGWDGSLKENGYVYIYG